MLMMKVEKVMTAEEIKSVVASELSKSEKMKQMFLGGIDVKTISEIMGTRYNFVYNVVSNMVRTEDLEDKVNKTESDSRKKEIIEMFKAGKSNIEISKALKCNYNYVWKICNEELKK